MKILKEFRDFIMRGNVIDIAIAIMMGGVFQRVIESLVRDVMTPLLGLIIGQQDFSNFFIGPVRIGNFINALVSFLLTGLAIFFLIVKPYKKLEEIKRKKASVPGTEPPSESKEIELLRAILEELQRIKKV